MSSTDQLIQKLYLLEERKTKIKAPIAKQLDNINLEKEKIIATIQPQIDELLERQKKIEQQLNSRIQELNQKQYEIEKDILPEITDIETEKELLKKLLSKTLINETKKRVIKDVKYPSNYTRELIKLTQRIKEHRKVRDTTIETYQRHLNRLSLEICKAPFSNINFIMTDTDLVIEFLESQSISVRKNFLSAILVVLSPEERKKPAPEYKEVYDCFSKMLKKDHVKYTEQISSHNKNTKENENWLEWSQIIQIREELYQNVKEITEKEELSNQELRKLQKYLVLCLYTMHPPRRLEYADTVVITQDTFQQLPISKKNDNIFLVIGQSKQLCFGKNMVKSSTSENVIINVCPELSEVLDIWLKHNTKNYLLLDSRGNKLTKNGLSKLLRRIFDHTGKNISASMLRKIKISSEFDPIVADKQQKLARSMNHSVEVQQTVYLKNS